LKEARARFGEQTRTILRPLLLDIIDVRDRLAAGLAAVPPENRSPWWSRWRRTASVPDPWREGLEMTLRRLDRVVAARDDPSVAQGLVIAESRTGFEWDGQLLRAAEVIVAKRASARDRSDRGDVE